MISIEDFPLTKPQQGIYDLERFAAGAAGIAASILFRGTLNLSSMKRALRTVLETNDALRLRITREGRQWFAPPEEEDVPVMHFDSREAFHSWATQQAAERLDMYGKLYRFVIVTVDDCFGLFLCFHHIIMDAWSAALFASRLHAYYCGKEVPESPSYQLFMQQDALRLQSDRAAKERDFWLSHFSSVPEPCFLAKKPSSTVASARWVVFLSKEEALPLRVFAQQQHLSIFHLLMMTLAVYLQRVRGQNEICVGTTTMGRTNLTMKRTIGMFAGTVPVPVHPELEKSFSANTKTLADTLLAALRRERFGYQDILAELKQRDGFHGKLYDVIVNYQNAAVADMGETFEGTQWYHCGVQPETLQLQMGDQDNTGGLQLSYDYQCAQFCLEEIQQLHERLMTLLKAAIASPEKPIAQLPLFCQADQQAWAALNQTDHPVALRPVHRFFEDQAALHPEQKAVIFNAQSLTYRQLNEWADRIAALLRAKGLHRGAIVALRMERCLELMPLLLGIMKAGCAYLPLLPTWPQDRARFILQDAKAALLICQPACSISQLEIETMETGTLYDLPTADTAESNSDLSCLAYVLYTSGSTGQPKGVRIGQDSLCNRLLWMESKYPLAEDEILIQKTSYAFDVSAWELFWALMQGRTLLLPEPGAEKDPRRMAELIRQFGIRTIHFVPSVLSLFLDDLNITGQPLPPLRQVIVSGEALTPALNQRFYTCFAGTETSLHNLYGPTECTVDVLYYDCMPDDVEIPIGKPVWNTGVHVLDANGHPLPMGEIGELCITGIQLAKGYINPALDEGRFQDHPSLGRIYRTGDQCSLRKDEQILYHGRNDGQIKIRGQRVELAEIERQLEQLPDILRAAVYYDGTNLHAFLCTERDLNQRTILNDLRTRLPNYMLPDRFHHLAALPLNANGKLNRKKLAELAANQSSGTTTAPVSDSPPRLPVTEQERQLMAAVQAHLGGQPVSMDENPARCGLSSLDIVSATMELEAQGLLLRVNDFYTASDFSALAKNAQNGAEPPLLHQLTASKQDETLACIGIPYGGGSFGAWADVAQRLPIPMIAVQSAHENPDDLLQKLRDTPYERFIVTGSCVGSGLALALAQRLDAENKLAGLCLVAAAPPTLVRLYGRCGHWLNPWKFRGPAAVTRALQRAAERELRLGHRETVQLRADAAWFMRFLAKTRRIALRAPIHLIYGANDPMLLRVPVKRRWERFLSGAVEERVIPGAKHDLLHTHAGEIAQEVIRLSGQ